MAIFPALQKLTHMCETWILLTHIVKKEFKPYFVQY